MRSRTRETARSLAALISLAALVAAAAPAFAELTPWDQEAVTEIAGELNQATRDLRAAARRQPPPTLGQPGRHAFHQIRDELGAIETASRRLHTALQAGEGREATLPTYRRLIRSVRNVANELPRVPLQKPVTTKLDTAADALRRLRPFYEEQPIL